MREEYIILKWVGQWVLHETPAVHNSLEDASLTASELDCKALVLSVEHVAEVFEAFIKRDLCN